LKVMDRVSEMGGVLQKKAPRGGFHGGGVAVRFRVRD